MEVVFNKEKIESDFEKAEKFLLDPSHVNVINYEDFNHESFDVNNQDFLNEIAQNRNQSLAQMAISWILKDDRITSVLIGASKTEQILDSLKAIKNTTFSKEEIEKISE